MNRTLHPLRAVALAALVASCVAAPGTKTPTAPEAPPVAAADPDPAIPPEQVAPLPKEAVDKPPSQVAPTDGQKRLDAALTAWLANNATRRFYLMLDKPLYQPGETIWVAGSLAASATLIASPGGTVSYGLISPRGAQVMARSVRVDERGIAAADFELPADLVGGEYTLRARSSDGTTEERKLIVSSYETPRLKKTLELLKKGYGPGDPVVAAVSVARGTGEPMADKVLTAVATVDDGEVARLRVTTDGAGNAAIRFALPPKIERGDALLTVSVEDAGITESVQKRIPVLLKAVKLQLFPEGGDLTVGLPSRVYFAATTPLGKPADVEGKVVDERGKTIAKFASLHDGLGRFALQPARERSYHVEITRPTGIEEKFPLPAARGEGCTLQASDDFDSQGDEAKVAVWCTGDRTVIAEAVLRERRIASASADVVTDAPTVIALPIPKGTQGALRVTLLSQQFEPLAERLVYRGRGNDLHVTVSAAKSKLSPRDPVELTVETRDASGRPVAAAVGVAVVDDTVISLADDKSAGILAHLYLEKDLGLSDGATIEEPNFYFSQKPHAAAALDLLVGTRGWRRFDWKMMLTPPVQHAYNFDASTVEGDLLMVDGAEAAKGPLGNFRLHGAGGGGKGQGLFARRAGVGGPPAALVVKAEPAGADLKMLMGPVGDAPRKLVLQRQGFGRLVGAKDLAADDERLDQAAIAWAPVREFPIPDYSKPSDGPRSDFRETVYWNPSLATGADGRAKVKFYLSDAVTSFRATVEGRSQGGLPGRGEFVMQSKLPLSLEAKLPLEVSSGDTIRLPVTVANETDRPLDATLTAHFGAAFKLSQDPASAPLTLQPGERRTFFYPLTVVGNSSVGDAEGDGEVELAAATDGLRDELKKKIRVVPVGFPGQAAASGTVKDRVFHDFDLGAALPHTVAASVTVYPSPLQQMVQGAEGMLQEPSGCFEQTSSTNYPNVMVSEYLVAHDVTDPKLIEKSHGLLERGYKRLTGYESPKHGFEWFGGNPGHEALTAYGLMEFNEMQKVYGEVDHTMIDRTAGWLYSRRDGKGGYLRNPQALDSFGGAPPDVTNGYITWALTEAGKRDLSVEIAAARTAGEGDDPYLVALAANTLLNVKDPAAPSVLARLVKLQAKDGSFPGAKTTITRSGGAALGIETTALATLAMMKGGSDEAAVRAGVEWIGKHDQHGAYGSTQSTVLALKAINLYAERSRRAASAGVVTLFVNGKQAGRVAFDKGAKEAIVFDDVAGALVAGKNTVELRLEGAGPLPYAMSVDYRTAQPASSPDAKVRLETRLARDNAQMGETVRMHAVVENVTKEGLPMVLARIGLPGGLTFQTWQLKELRDKGVIDFYETRQREVIVYYRAMAPEAKKSIDLDLMAYTPGSFTGPASSAYLYYTNEAKSWTEPTAISVGP